MVIMCRFNGFRKKIMRFIFFCIASSKFLYYSNLIFNLYSPRKFFYTLTLHLLYEIIFVSTTANKKKILMRGNRNKSKLLGIINDNSFHCNSFII